MMVMVGTSGISVLHVSTPREEMSCDKMSAWVFHTVMNIGSR